MLLVLLFSGLTYQVLLWPLLSSQESNSQDEQAHTDWSSRQDTETELQRTARILEAIFPPPHSAERRSAQVCVFFLGIQASLICRAATQQTPRPAT